MNANGFEAGFSQTPTAAAVVKSQGRMPVLVFTGVQTARFRWGFIAQRSWMTAAVVKSQATDGRSGVGCAETLMWLAWQVERRSGTIAFTSAAGSVLMVA